MAERDHFSDKDRMVSALMGRGQFAIDPTQDVFQNRRAGYGLMICGRGKTFFAIKMILRKTLGEGLLLRTQDVDREATARSDEIMALRSLIHANQNQRRVQRQRAKRIRGQTVICLACTRRHDRHAGGERAHGLAEFSRRNRGGRCLHLILSGYV